MTRIPRRTVISGYSGTFRDLPAAGTFINPEGPEEPAGDRRKHDSGRSGCRRRDPLLAERFDGHRRVHDLLGVAEAHVVGERDRPRSTATQLIRTSDVAGTCACALGGPITTTICEDAAARRAGATAEYAERDPAHPTRRLVLELMVERDILQNAVAAIPMNPPAASTRPVDRHATLGADKNGSERSSSVILAQRATPASDLEIETRGRRSREGRVSARQPSFRRCWHSFDVVHWTRWHTTRHHHALTGYNPWRRRVS